MPPRTPLTRKRVLAVALELVDEEGLESLTMRRLGLKLGVEAMSLYRHVDGRGALLDGIHETILGELELPRDVEPRRSTWVDAVRAYACAFRRVLIAHPHALVLFATRPAVAPASLEHIDRGLGVLREGAGFDIHDAVSAFQTVVTWVVGHALSTHAVIPKEDEATPIYVAPATSSMRWLREASSLLSTRDLDEEFEFGLDVVVEGLARKARRKARRQARG